MLRLTDFKIVQKEQKQFTFDATYLKEFGILPTGDANTFLWTKESFVLDKNSFFIQKGPEIEDIKVDTIRALMDYVSTVIYSAAINDFKFDQLAHKFLYLTASLTTSQVSRVVRLGLDICQSLVKNYLAHNIDREDKFVVWFECYLPSMDPTWRKEVFRKVNQFLVTLVTTYYDVTMACVLATAPEQQMFKWFHEFGTNLKNKCADIGADIGKHSIMKMVSEMADNLKEKVKLGIWISEPVLKCLLKIAFLITIAYLTRYIFSYGLQKFVDFILIVFGFTQITMATFKTIIRINGAANTQFEDVDKAKAALYNTFVDPKNQDEDYRRQMNDLIGENCFPDEEEVALHRKRWKEMQLGSVATTFFPIIGKDTNQTEPLWLGMNAELKRRQEASKKRPEPGTETIEENGGKETIITALFETVKGLFSEKDADQVKLDMMRMARLSASFRLIHDLRKFGETVYDVTENLIQYVYERIYGYPLSMDEKEKECIESYTQLFQNFKKIENLKDNELMEESNKSVIVDCKKKSDDLRLQFTALEKCKHTLIFVNTITTKIDTLYAKMLIYLNQSKFRIPTSILYLWGEPGQGKSNCMRMLATHAYYAMTGKQMTANDIFAKPMDTVFFDGYIGQWMVQLDDLCQGDNIDDNRALIYFLICAQNDAHFPLNFAELTRKGTLCYTSRLTAVTSNKLITGLGVGINEPVAITRRFDVCYKVERVGDSKDKIKNWRFYKTVFDMEGKFQVSGNYVAYNDVLQDLVNVLVNKEIDTSERETEMEKIPEIAESIRQAVINKQIPRIDLSSKFAKQHDPNKKYEMEGNTLLQQKKEKMIGLQERNLELNIVKNELQLKQMEEKQIKIKQREEERRKREAADREIELYEDNSEEEFDTAEEYYPVQREYVQQIRGQIGRGRIGRANTTRGRGTHTNVQQHSGKAENVDNLMNPGKEEIKEEYEDIPDIPISDDESVQEELRECAAQQIFQAAWKYHPSLFATTVDGDGYYTYLVNRFPEHIDTIKILKVVMRQTFSEANLMAHPYLMHDNTDKCHLCDLFKEQKLDFLFTFYTIMYDPEVKAWGVSFDPSIKRPVLYVSDKELRDYLNKEGASTKILDESLCDVRISSSDPKTAHVHQFLASQFIEKKEVVQSNNGKYLLIVGAIGLVAAGIGIFYAVQNMKSEEDEPIREIKQNVTQMGSGTKEQRRQGRKRERNQPKLRKMEQVQQNSGSDQNADQLVPIVQRNIVSFKYGEFGTLATALKERYFITAKHYKFFLDKTKQVTMTDYKKKTYVINTSDIVYLEVQDCDAMIMKINDKAIPEFKDITNYFMGEDEVEMGMTAGVGLVLPGRIEYTQQTQHIGPLRYPGNKEANQPDNLNMQTFAAVMPGQPGWCGCLYLVRNIKCRGKILGMHIAGSRWYSYGVYITTELLQQLDAEQQMFHFTREDGSIVQTKVEIEPKFDNIRKLGVTTLPAIQATNTEIRPTLINDFTENRKIPAQIGPQRDSNGQWTYPIAKAIMKKSDRKVNMFWDEKCDEICEFLKKSQKYFVPAELLSEKQMYNGYTGLDSIGALELSTSLGYPWNTMHFKEAGKNHFVQRDPISGVLYPNEEWQENVDLAEEYLRDEFFEWNSSSFFAEMDLWCRGLREKPFPVPYICDLLKDELRDKKKVINFVDQPQYFYIDPDTGKYCFKAKNWSWVSQTRLMGPITCEYLLLSRKYFGSYYTNCIIDKEGCTTDMGLNVHSLDVHMMMLRNLPCEPEKVRAICGDLKTCDGSIPPAINLAHMAHIENYYLNGGTWELSGQHDEYGEPIVSNSYVLDRMCRERLYKSQTTESIHIAGNLIYQTNTNCSGWFLTIDTNKFAVKFGIMYAVLEKYPHDHEKLRYIEEHCRFLGDDHILFMKEDDMWITMKDIARAFAKFGMEYTSCYKDEELPDSYSLKDAMYLKRHFLKDEHGMWHMALDKETLEEIPLWGTYRMDPIERTRTSCEMALREAFHWGKEYFEQFTKKLNKKLQKVNVPPITHLSYDKLMQEFLGIVRNEVLPEPILEHLKLGLHLQYMKKTPDIVEYKGIVCSADVSQQMSSDRTDRKEASGKPDQFHYVRFEDLVGQGEITNAQNITPVYHKTNSILDKDTLTRLTNPYQIKTIDWSSTHAAGQVIGNCDFPLDLGVPNLKAKLKFFNFLRASIKVKLIFNTTKLQYGRLVVAWIPYSPTATMNWNQLDDIYSAVNNHHSTISIQTQETLELHIPYLNLSAYWDENRDPDLEHYIMGKLIFFVKHPLTDGSTASTVTTKIVVMACFDNIDLAGPNPLSEFFVSDIQQQMEQPDPTHTIDPPQDIYGKAPQQSVSQRTSYNFDSNQDAEAKKGSGSGFMDLIGKAVSFVSYGFGWGRIASFAGSLLGSLLDYQQRTYAAPLNQNLVERRKLVTTANFSQTSGLNEAINLANTQGSAVSNDWRVYCTPVDYDSFSNYKLLPSLLFYTIYADATTTPGTLLAIIPVDPMRVNKTIDSEMKPVYYPTHLSNLANEFTFWRGGLKYQIEFTCSMFMSGRFRIMWLPDGTTSASVPIDQMADAISLIVDVNGDTVTQFYVPYLQDKDWRCVGEWQTNSAGWTAPASNARCCNGQIRIYLETPIAVTQTITTSKIYLSCTMSGAEDFEVMKPRQNQNYYIFYQAPEMIEKYNKQRHSSLKRMRLVRSGDVEENPGPIDSVVTDTREVFRKPFNSIVPSQTRVTNKINNPDNVGSWTELCHRYTYHNTETLTTAELHYCDVLPATDSNPAYTQKNRALTTFLFFRGSYRVKFLYRTGDNTKLFYVHNFDLVDENYSLDFINGQEGMHVHNFQSLSSLDVQVPYYNNEPFIHLAPFLTDGLHRNILAYNFADTPSTATAISAFYAFGDDWSMGYPISPFKVTLAPISSKGSNRPQAKFSFTTKENKNSNELPTKRNSKSLE